MAKQIKMTILMDEFYVADSLHEIASRYENSDMEGDFEWEDGHYMVTCTEEESD